MNAHPTLFLGPAPLSPTSLDLPEIPDHSDCASPPSSPPTIAELPPPPYGPPATLSGYTFRHSGWSHNRQRTYDALHALAEPHARQDAFARCGSRCWVLRHREDPDQYKFVTDTCHDRFCVPCSRHQAAVVTANLAAHLQDPPYRLITLTLRTGPNPLAPALARLAKSFKRLRARQCWKERVTGGIAFLEIKWNPVLHRWHPHLHVITHGKYFPQALLSHTWLDITGDSTIVHITLIRSHHAISSYITKYVTKPLDSKLMSSPPRLREAIAALKGKRIFIAFGLWSRWKLHQHQNDDHWTVLGHINEIFVLESISREVRDALLLAYANYATNPELAQVTIRSPPSPKDLEP